MSTQLSTASAVARPFIPELLPFAELARRSHPAVRWLWQGYLAAGNVTLFTSQWKTGKTTLLGVLLSKFVRGGEVGGLPVVAGRTCVLSEESAEHWIRRGERFDFGPDVRFCCRPFPGKPSSESWRELIAGLARPADEGPPFDLVVIDTLSALMPGGVENQADALLDVLRPLERLTAAGTAVLLMHHPRKGRVFAGQSARGSGALSAYADILVEMHPLANVAADDRRRRLSAWSRYDATPRERIVELSADGLEYRAAAEDPPPPEVDVELERGLKVILEVLERTREQHTREALVREWPERRKPSAATVWRWLECGLKRGLLDREGTGGRGSPYRYQLKGTQCPWNPMPDDVFDFRLF